MMDPIMNWILGNWQHLTLVLCCHQVCGYKTIHLPTMIAARTCPIQNPTLHHHRVVQCNILTMAVMTSNHHNVQSPQVGIVQMVMQNFTEYIILLSMVCNSTNPITTNITCHRPDLWCEQPWYSFEYTTPCMWFWLWSTWLDPIQRLCRIRTHRLFILSQSNVCQ